MDSPTQNVKAWPSLLVTASAAAWFLALSNRGINMTDEGVQVLYGYQVASGMVTYRDYFVPVAPLGFIIQAALIKLFGFHLIVGRMWAALQGVAAVMIALRIGRRHLGFPFSLIPAVMLIPLHAAFGFPHYNLDSAFFLLVCAAFLDSYLEKASAPPVFLAGLSGSLAVLCKQSMVITVVPLLALCLFLVYRKSQKGIMKHSFAAGAGLVLPAAALFMRYARAHALEEAYWSLSGVFVMKNVLLMQMLPGALGLLLAGVLAVALLVWAGNRRPSMAPVLWWAAGLAMVVWIVFSPAQVAGPFTLAMAVASLVLFVRSGDGSSRDFWRLARAYALLMFVATAMSGLDFSHMLIGCMGAVFLFGLLMQKLFSERHKRSMAALGVCALVAAFSTGIYLDLALPHLEHSQEPRWRATARVDIQGLELMRASPRKAEEIERTVKWLRKNTDPSEKIFVYPWDLLLYVFARRMPATYDTFLYYEIFSRDILGRVIQDLEENKPGKAVVRMEDNKIRHVALAREATAMESYLKRKYDPVIRFGHFQVMQRRQQR